MSPFHTSLKFFKSKKNLLIKITLQSRIPVFLYICTFYLTCFIFHRKQSETATAYLYLKCKSTIQARKTLDNQMSREKREMQWVEGLLDRNLIKRLVLKNFRNVMYAGWGRAWTTAHTYAMEPIWAPVCPFVYVHSLTGKVSLQ